MGHFKKSYGPDGHRHLRRNKDEYERFISKMKRKVEFLELIYSDKLKINNRLFKKEINALLSPFNSYWREKNFWEIKLKSIQGR